MVTTSVSWYHFVSSDSLSLHNNKRVNTAITPYLVKSIV